MSSIANLHAAALGLRDCYTFAADPRVLPGAIVWKVLLVVVFSRAFALLRIFLLIAALFSFNSLLTPTTAGFAQSTVPDQYDVSHLAGGPGGAGYLDGTGLQARLNGPTGIWLSVHDRQARRQPGMYGVAVLVGPAGAPPSISRNLSLWADGSFLYLTDDSTIRKLNIATGEVKPLRDRRGGRNDPQGRD